MKNLAFAIMLLISASVFGQSFSETIDAATVARNENRYKDAIELYKKALLLDNDNSNICFTYNKIGLTYNEMQQPDSAIYYCNLTLKIHPNDTIALYYRAHSYMDKNQFEAALKDFIHSFEGTHKKNPDACFNIGKCYSELTNFTKAIEYYKTTLVLQPNDKYSYYEIGFCYASLKIPQKDEALKYYSKAIELDDNYYHPYYNRGLLYASQFNDFPKAHADLQKSIKIRPKSKLSYLYDARLYHRENDLGASKDVYNKLIDLYPDYGQAYLDRATVWYDIGILNMACKDIAKADSLGEPEAKEFKEKICK